ncbi:MAG TPA: Ig-like domain-containing protein [Steroidobacteraceae bacterium]|jgi:methionine-rich copper-binding protein CopC|nr:Ig-like domain-containing protein [Steroidobacteraceae bacterium]
MSSAEYRFMVALLAAAATGCAGNGNGLDANGNPVTPGAGGGTPLTADFQSIQANVFTPICTKCHIGGGAPEGLQLDAANSYAMLVGVPSAEQPAVMRVAPGAPANSYIIRKLQGTAGISGGQMPLGGPYLPQSTIDVIAQWITAGAPKPAAAMSLGASVKAVQHFNVATTSPANGTIASMALPQIVVAFNGDIDSTLLNNTTVTLARTDAAQSMQAMPPPMPVTTTVPAGNPSAILITPRTPLTNGTYRVTLQKSLANMNAQALGTDYSFTFTVDVLK